MAIEEIRYLNDLSFEKQLAFAFLASERVYPHYVAFSSTFNFGDSIITKTAIDFVYTSLFTRADGGKIDDLLKQIDVNVPYPENFATSYASVAMYSSGVIYESVNLLKRDDIARILHDISTLCTDAIDLYIQERDDMEYGEPDFELKILNDPLMQTELTIQKGIVTYLSSIGSLSRADIDTLLKLQEKGTGTLVLLDKFLG